MLEQRLTVRYPVRFRSSFSSTNLVQGEGEVVDVSVRGCRIDTTTTVLVGTVLELQLYLVPEEPPLLVREAVVRWTKGPWVGMEFVSLLPAEWDRLQLFVRELARTRPR